MIYKSLFGVLAVAVLVLVSTATGVAQTGELRGKVFLQQADGQKVPLGEADIDVFRTDMSMNKPYTTKANKKGEFVFAGLPFVGTYTVAASHATAQPNFVPGVKVGRDITFEIVVTPGDGKRLTFEEIKGAGGGTAKPAEPAKGGNNSGGGESAEEKAKREELIRKNKEIEESNKKIEAANAIIARTFKAGNEALNAANLAVKANNSAEGIAKYTEAITQYNEGLAADGDQPALLTNRSIALKARGVERYNASIKETEDAAKNAALEGAKADFKAASESSAKAVQLIKAAPVPSDPAEQQRFNGNKYAALLTNAEAMRLFVSKVDFSKGEEGLAAFKDYMAAETDPVKKAKAQLDAAQMLLDAGDGARALAEYQSILATQPDNPDANLGAGLAMYTLNDKTKFQDAANYLQHFVDVAPDSHKFKSSAKEILAALKSTENVVPEKTPPKKKRP